MNCSMTFSKTSTFTSIALLCLLAIISSAQTPAAKTPIVFTEKDREFALKYLNDTKTDFVKELTGLSDAQLNFRAAPNRWTVAEVAEHIILSEGVILGLIQGPMMKSPAAAADVFRAKDTGVILAITNRSQKFTAPEMLKPNSRFKTLEELLSNFEKSRNQTIDFVKNNKTDLRSHFFDNPMMGMIDGYQWLLFLNGHSERHLMQLKEVKTDRKYPAK